MHNVRIILIYNKRHQTNWSPFADNQITVFSLIAALGVSAGVIGGAVGGVLAALVLAAVIVVVLLVLRLDLHYEY